nr:MAG TPA: hypothetical protein [Caudoviricetes sp.]
MLKGITENGEMKNVKLSENGAMKVELEVSKGGLETTSSKDREITLIASVLSIGTEEQSIVVNKKVTSIMAANYSETADITLNAGGTDLQIGANLALELPVNLQVENLTIVSTEADTKIQLVVKGVE